MRKILVRSFYLFLIVALFAILDLMSLDEEVLSESYQEAFTTGDRDNEILQFVSGGHVLGFRKGDMILASRDHALRVEFVNARPVSPTDDGVSSNTENEQQAAKPLGRVTYRDLWDGIGLVYENHPSGVVKSTYYVKPTESSNANPADRIRLRYNVPVEVDEGGHLVFSFETGQMRESRPVAWQEIDGKHISVDVSFRSFSKLEVGFKVGVYDPHFPLVIDPVISWITFIGGADYDFGTSMAVDSIGNVYVAGRSYASWGTPVNPFSGFDDVFVAKLNSSAELQWHTFMGGADVDFSNTITMGGSGNVYLEDTSDVASNMPISSYDSADAIAVDSSGNVYVVGRSRSTWGTPVNPHTGDGVDGFAAKLNSNGALQWNTFMGSTSSDSCNALGVDASGNIYVAGNSPSTWGTPVNPHSGGGLGEGFVAKLNSNGVLQWNTFMGSTASDYCRALTLDGSGNIYVGGESNYTWGTPVNPWVLTYDAFVAKLNNNGERQWNTFMGGQGSDYCYALAVDGSGNIYVGGESNYTWGTPVNPFAGGDWPDAFAAKLNNLGVLQWNTFMGSGAAGWCRDYGHAIDVDGSGYVYLAGYSYQTWGIPANPHVTGGYDAFVAKLNNSGVHQCHTFMGGAGHDYGHAIAVDGSGNIYVAGESQGTWGTPVNPYAGGGYDVFVVKIGVPSVTVTSPNGGEIWHVGSTHDVTWTTSGLLGRMKIEISTDNGSNWNPIISSTENDGVHPWTVPYPVSSQCLMRISEIDGIPSDTSDAVFSTVLPPPSITVTSPNGGEIWDTGSTYNITWAQVRVPGIVVIDLYKGGAYSSNIGTVLANSLSFPWMIPLNLPDGNDYKVRIYQGSVGDYSDEYFSIYKKNIISGRVSGETSGIEGVVMVGLPGDPTTDALGHYEAAVSWGWSGRVVPNKTGYQFLPQYRDYLNVISNRLNQNFYGSDYNNCRFYRSGSWTGAGHGSDGWYVGDFNGDGIEDIFRVLPGTSGADVFLSNGTRFWHSGSWTGVGRGSDGWYVGDFNGDGRDDIFRVVPGVSGADVFLSNGTRFYPAGSWTGVGRGSDGWYVGDFNGDGRDDIFRYLPGSSGADVFLSNGISFYRSGSWTGSGHGTDGWYVGDFNGDGRDDIFRVVSGVSGADVFLSSETKFIYSGSWTGAGNGTDGWYVGDFNGDGRDDIFRYVPSVSGADVFLTYCVSSSSFSIAFKESLLALDEDMMLDVYGMRETEMSYEEEAEFLWPFMERAMKGEEVSVYEIKRAYEEAVEHPVRLIIIRQLLNRHSF